MAGKRYTFVLNFGYVENANVSYMPWTSNQTYKDAKDALVDLANFLKEQYLVEYGDKIKKCCVATKIKDPQADFCTKCGKSLKVEDFSYDHFEGWVREMGDTNIDSFHGYIAYDDRNRWQTGQLEGAPNQRFVYQADWVLSAALGYPQRKDRTFEVICKERTKNRTESFSYY